MHENDLGSAAGRHMVEEVTGGRMTRREPGRKRPGCPYDLGSLLAACGGESQDHLLPGRIGQRLGAEDAGNVRASAWSC